MSNAKIRGKDLQVLRGAIRPLDTELRRQAYLDGDYPRASGTRDVDRRYRWDLLWCAFPTVLPVADDVTDEHLDTALRSIVPPLREEQA